MRRNDAARRPSVLQRLFAERQVYLRSGPESRYVVISSGLQAGVTLVFLLGLAILGIALYSSIDKHLEAAEQSRELARLEGVNRSLLAAAEATRGDAEEDAAARSPDLTARLEEAEASRARAEQLAEAASAESEEIRRELDLALTRVDEATTQIAALEAERDALLSQLNARVDPAAGTEGVEPARRALNAEIADLTAERAALQAELDQLRVDADANASELARAEEEVAALQGRLDETAGLREDEVEQLEVRIATLQAENEQLTQAIDEIQSARHELETRLQEAEADQADAGEVEDLRAELAAAERRVAELERQVEDAGEPAGGADEAEVARLREELAAAEQRVAELERQAEDAGEPAGGADEAEVARLREELAAAEQRVAELEREGGPEAGGAGSTLQRRPAVGDQALGSDFSAEADARDPAAAPAPAYRTAAETVRALEAELTAAEELVAAASSDDGASPEAVADLRAQIENAARRIQGLDQTLARLEARDVALQQALATLAPLPPPPAPR